MGLSELEIVEDVKPDFHVMESTGTYMLLIASPLTLLKRWRHDQYLYQAAYRIDTSELSSLLPGHTVKAARLLQEAGNTLYGSSRRVYLLLNHGVLVTFEVDESRKEMGSEMATAVAVERLFHIFLLLAAVAYFLYTGFARNFPRLIRP